MIQALFRPNFLLFRSFLSSPTPLTQVLQHVPWKPWSSLPSKHNWLNSVRADHSVCRRRAGNCSDFQISVGRALKVSTFKLWAINWEEASSLASLSLDTWFLKSSPMRISHPLPMPVLLLVANASVPKLIFLSGRAQARWSWHEVLELMAGFLCFLILRVLFAL